MEARIKPRELEAALTRLTGASYFRKTKESVEWRLVVRSSDGEEIAVRPQASMHRSEIAKAALNDIARRLRLDRADLDEVLSSWSHEQLVEHLQRFTAEQLREPAMRRFRRG